MGIFDFFKRGAAESRPSSHEPSSLTLLDLQLAITPQDLPDAIGDFALDLHRGCAANAVCSPLSVYEAWLRVWGGSAGACRTELGQALGLGDADVRAELRAWSAKLEAAMHHDCTVTIANTIWTRPDLRIEPAFEEEWGGSTRELEFSDADHAAAVINAWVSDHTQGMIADIVNARMITPATAIVLANAIYLNAKWSVPFEGHRTHDGVFHGLRGDAQVPMMWDRDPYRVAASADFELLAKPYHDGKLAFVVVLPRAGAFERVREQLSWATVRAAMRGSTNLETSLSLPRFEVDSSPMVDELLQSRGAAAIYDQHAADLTAMSPDARVPGRELFVDRTVHRARIDVNEAGTEAAAATVVMAPAGSAPPPPPPFTMVVDRPFLFFVIEESAHLPLFAGQFVGPDA